MAEVICAANSFKQAAVKRTTSKLHQFDPQISADESELLHLALPVGHAKIRLHELALQGLGAPQHTGVLVNELLEVTDEKEVQLLVCVE